MVLVLVLWSAPETHFLYVNLEQSCTIGVIFSFFLGVGGSKFKSETTLKNKACFPFRLCLTELPTFAVYETEAFLEGVQRCPAKVFDAA